MGFEKKRRTKKKAKRPEPQREAIPTFDTSNPKNYPYIPPILLQSFHLFEYAQESLLPSILLS